MRIGFFDAGRFDFRAWLVDDFYTVFGADGPGQPIYREFAEWIAGQMYGELPYIQKVPTFRRSLPGHVEPFHTDDEKGHQPGTLTCWVALTDAWDSNTLWIDGQPLDMAYGRFVVFDPIAQRHGQPMNLTDHTRLSFDFRMIAKNVFRPTTARSVNTHQLLAPGDYFQ